jgi:hypothetical protein
MEFSKEEVQMASKYVKKYSTSLALKEIQVKTTLRFHLTPVQKAIIKGNINNKCWQGCGETGTLIHYWWECKLVQPIWKAVWRFLRKLEIELPYNTSDTTPGIYQKERETDTIETPVY